MLRQAQAAEAMAAAKSGAQQGDPLALRDLTFPDLPMTRELGYTLGFFVFWLATASSSLFTWILLRPASRFNRPLPPD